MRKLSLSLSLVAGLVCGSAAMAADWGDLKMKFSVDGKVAALPALKVDKDLAVCGKKPMPDEELVAGPNGELQNVIVFLVPEKGGKLTIHPDYETSKAAEVLMDNKDCRFEPHVALVRVGQTLVLKNSDAVGHNSKIDFTTNPPVNPIIPATAEQKFKPSDITKAEKRASPVSCSIHPWMKGWVLVQEHPYMGTTNAKGELEIKNIPTGSYTFQVWHEKIGNLSSTNTTDSAGKAVAWSKGKATIAIKAGANDQGAFKVKVN